MLRANDRREGGSAARSGRANATVPRWGLVMMLLAALSPTHSPNRIHSSISGFEGATAELVRDSDVYERFQYRNDRFEYRDSAEPDLLYARFSGEQKAHRFARDDDGLPDVDPRTSGQSRRATGDGGRGPRRGRKGALPSFFASRLKIQRRAHRAGRPSFAAPDSEADDDAHVVEVTTATFVEHLVAHDAPAPSALSDVDGSSDNTPTRPMSPAAQPPGELRHPTQTLRDLTDVQLANALAFLPLRDIEMIREVPSENLRAAVDLVAPRPIVGSPGAVFVRIPHLGSGSEPSVASVTKDWDGDEKPLSRREKLARVCNRQSTHPWYCSSCNTVASSRSACEFCGSKIQDSAIRIFLGQLHKNNSTAAMASFMLRSLCPSVDVLHVEPHTNPRDGRSKGCAWIYLKSRRDAQLLQQIHRRVFFDCDGDGFEGFWFIHDQASLPNLQALANGVGHSPQRPWWLPRNLLVAEIQQPITGSGCFETA